MESLSCISSLAEMKYLIIDETSMVGRKILGQVDLRLRQIFLHHAHQMLGGCSCVLFGDFGQLPLVMDTFFIQTPFKLELE